MTLAQLSISGRLAFLAKDAAIYGIAGGLNKVIALLTFPLLARHFEVADYGTIDLINTLVLVGTVLAVFGQDSAVARFFFESTDEQYKKQVVSQSFALQVSFTTALVVSLFIFSESLAPQLKLGVSGAFLIKMIALQIPCLVLINFSQNILKWTFRKGAFALVSIGTAATTALGFIIGLQVSDFTVADVLTVYLASRAFFGLLGLFLVREWLQASRALHLLKQLVPYAVPFGLLGLLITALPFIERTLIQAGLTAHDLGLYAAGAKVAMLIALPISAFEIAWVPFALALFREKNAAATYQITLKIIAFALMAIALVLTAFGEFILTMLASARYEGGGIVVFALCMSLAMEALGSVLGIGVLIAKKSTLKLPGYAAMVLVASLTIPPLITQLGIAGAALGSLAGYATKTLIEAILARRAYPLGFEYGRVIGFILVVFVIGLTHIYTYQNLSHWGVSPLPLLASAIMIPWAWYLLLTKVERETVARRIAKRRFRVGRETS